MKTSFVKQSVNNDATWLPFSDLMSVLMLFFMLVAAITIIRSRKKVEKISQSHYNLRKDIYLDLNASFDQDSLDAWDAIIDPSTLTIRFKKPEFLFSSGSDTLSPSFTNILDYFFPKYVSVILKYKDNIEEIRIEGHTSSDWKGVNLENAYFKNMELSQDRTRSVLMHVLKNNSGEIKSNYRWLKEHISANGLSSSQLILDKNNMEDKTLSRRVEFRIKTDSEKKLDEIEKLFSK